MFGFGKTERQKMVSRAVDLELKYPEIESFIKTAFLAIENNLANNSKQALEILLQREIANDELMPQQILMRMVWDRLKGE